MKRRDRSHLRLVPGGKTTDEHRASFKLCSVSSRVVRAEPRPDPNPPRTAA